MQQLQEYPSSLKMPAEPWWPNPLLGRLRRRSSRTSTLISGSIIADFFQQLCRNYQTSNVLDIISTAPMEFLSFSLKEFGAILDDSNSMVPAKYMWPSLPCFPSSSFLLSEFSLLRTFPDTTSQDFEDFDGWSSFPYTSPELSSALNPPGVQDESYQDDAYNGGSEDDQDEDSVYDGGAYDGSGGGSSSAYDGSDGAYDDSNSANDKTVQNPFQDSIINPYLPGYIPPNPVAQRSASQRSAPYVLKSRYTGEPPAPLKTTGIHFFQNEVDGRFTYQTTTGAFSCSHQAEGEPNRYSDSSCALACYLNLVYVHVLGGFVYLKEHRMFGRAELESRLLGIWVIKKRENKVQMVEDLLVHIDTAFPTLLTNFDSIFRGSVGIRLIKKIPYLPGPKKTTCCPFCSLYFTTGTSANKHLRNGDKQCPLSDESRFWSDALEQQWTQSLSNEPANMRYAVRFVDAYDPALDTDDPVPTQTAYKPKLEPLQRPLYYPDTWWRFLAEINFRPLLPIEQQLLGEGLAPGILFDLVRLPSVAIKSYAEGTRESKLEKMLSLCHLFFKLYLMEAAAKVSSTFGFSKMLKKSSGLNYKGGFRRSDTYATYGGAGTNIICFLLRYFEMKRKKKLPALLRISLGVELLEAVKRLYLESQKDYEPSVSKLAPFLHAILVCFVRNHDPLDSDKLTLLEYILLCLTIREETKTREDAMVAGGWEEQYHLPSPEDAAISDAELDHIDDSDSDSSSTDSDPENDFDLEDLVDVTKFTPEQVTLGERLDEALREYVSKDSTKKNTFRVLISLWARADGYSRSAKGKKSFRPDASNLGFTFIPTPTSEIHCDLAIFHQNHELQLKGLQTSFAQQQTWWTIQPAQYQSLTSPEMPRTWPPPQFSKMPFFAPGMFSAPAPPSDIQGEDIPLQDVPLDTVVTSEKGKGREIEDDVQSPYTDVETEIEDGVQSPLFTDIEMAMENGGAGTQSKKTKKVEKQNRRGEKKRSKQRADNLLVPGGSKGVWGEKRKRQSKDDSSLKKSRDLTSSD
ncbi:hypothetical protein EV359DRAFT_66145 [Lentinula novae-zelandiae]|nr:hypothetical protein EV359DRAFT_66145 [Lentinula novae-zelandiae]